MFALQLRRRYPLVGVMGEQRVAGTEVGGRHPMLPERGHVGPSNLRLGRGATLLDQRVQQGMVEGRRRAVAGVENLPGVAVV